MFVPSKNLVFTHTITPSYKDHRTKWQNLEILLAEKQQKESGLRTRNLGSEMVKNCTRKK